MPEFVNIARVAEVPPGTSRVVEVGERVLAVFNVGGELFVLDNTCKHRGGPLGEGELEGTTVTCPWHGWTYDVVTGVSPDDSECAVDKFEVKIEGDSVLVGI